MREAGGAQMEHLLPRIAEIPNPVIVTGDFNTTGCNAHPSAGNPGFFGSLTSFRLWLPPLAFFFNPFPGILFPMNLVKNANDPTAANVPVLAPSEQRCLKTCANFALRTGVGLHGMGRNARAIKAAAVPWAAAMNALAKGLRRRFCRTNVSRIGRQIQD